MKKYAYPKKPNLKACPKPPTKPKGGIKTESQLEAFSKKVKVFEQKCLETKKINNKLKADYKSKVDKIEKEKKAVLKKEQDFKNKIKNLEKKLKCKCD